MIAKSSRGKKGNEQKDDVDDILAMMNESKMTNKGTLME